MSQDVYGEFVSPPETCATWCEGGPTRFVASGGILPHGTPTPENLDENGTPIPVTGLPGQTN